jgi:phospholipid N-methyltransferase
MTIAPARNATRSRSRVAELLLFAGNFLRHPHMLGSIIPSSRSLVDQVLAPIDWSRARVLVEYGPGVGTFTAEILRRMRSDARLVVIETNPDFVRHIATSLPDLRLRVELESAEHVQRILRRLGLPRASYVISGIPLGSMPRDLQSRIAVASRDVLEPGGEFLVYQFTSRVLPVLRETFHEVRRGFQARNFPPAQVFVCSASEPQANVAVQEKRARRSR